MTSFTPREIVSELDRFVIGQAEAKRSVAIALRNRWRRQQLSEDLKHEVLPKNILMIGPTGVGKTEIARRLAKLAQAPFIKVEATKFTEIGYVGRDVEAIIRDLLEISIHIEKEKLKSSIVARAEAMAEEKILDILVGPDSSAETRQKFRKMLREGQLDDRKIKIQVKDNPNLNDLMPTFDVPGMPGAQMGMMNLSDVFGKAMGQNYKEKETSVVEALEIVKQEESEDMLDRDQIVKNAVYAVEQNGIVFIDEIDKICARSERQGGDVSREGVQRDLLPLIEGTTVSTKHGPVKTDHILFVTSGAFHVSKPSDLLPELQGRLPIRVELKALNKQDFIRILTEPESSLIKQYVALLKTENVDLHFTDEAIQEISALAEEVNHTIENIGARRLHTMLEKILEEISFTAPDKQGEKFVIDTDYVQKILLPTAKSADLSKFIL